MTATVIPFDSEQVMGGRGNIIFDEMVAYTDQESDDPVVMSGLEHRARETIENQVSEWLSVLPDDAEVYEALTATSVSFNELRWESGVVVERITDHYTRSNFLRVAQSFYTSDKITICQQRILQLQGTVSSVIHELGELNRYIGAMR